MSKITNDGLTRSGTGCFNTCSHMATVGVKGLIDDISQMDIINKSSFSPQNPSLPLSACRTLVGEDTSHLISGSFTASWEHTGTVAMVIAYT